jgi:uncharacterized LabA/DUF88 family protein
MYHALKKCCPPRHKWLDLKAVLKPFVSGHTLSEVHYFSAYAHWKPQQMIRHRAYVAALEATGVTVHMARFSNKDRKCPKQTCGHEWVGHEEKETDVKIAVTILKQAIEDKFDRALIVSRDSDLVPAAKAMGELFPHKEVYVVAPPNAGHSTEMLQYCKGKYKIKVKNLDACLLPQTLKHPDGSTVTRPVQYDP